MTTDLTGFVACDCAADRVPLRGGLLNERHCRQALAISGDEAEESCGDRRCRMRLRVEAGGFIADAEDNVLR
jgi:hypothetical protein